MFRGCFARVIGLAVISILTFSVGKQPIYVRAVIKSEHRRVAHCSGEAKQGAWGLDSMQGQAEAQRRDGRSRAAAGRRRACKDYT